MAENEQIVKSPNSAKATPISAGQIVALSVILIVAAFLRFYHIGTFSLEMDELWSMEMSVGNGSVHDHFDVNKIRMDQPDVISLSGAPPWWHVWTHMGGVTAPPLYPLLLRFWMECFGQSAGAVRSLSAVFSLLGILLLFDICRMLHGVRVALFAAAIAAVAGVDIDLAQLARNYAIVTFELLCCADAIVRIEMFGGSARRWAAIALSVAAIAVTHYLAVSGAVALALYVLLRLRKADRWRTLAALIGGGILAAIVWGPWYLQQLHSLPNTNPDYLTDPTTEGHVGRTLARLLNVPFVFFLGFRAAAMMPLIFGRLVDVPIMLAPLLRLRWRRDLLMWVLLLFCTLAFLATVDLTRGWLLLQQFRFCTLAAPAVFALAATFDWPARPILRRWFPAATVAVLAMFAFQRISPGLTEWQDIHDYADLVDQRTEANDLLVFYGTDPYSMPGVNYMQLKYYASQTQRPWLVLTGPADLNTLNQFPFRESVWLIGPSEAETKASEILPGWHIALVAREREPVVLLMQRNQ